MPLGATNDEALEWLQLLKKKTTVKLDPQVNAFDYRILAIRTEERSKNNEPLEGQDKSDG